MKLISAMLIAVIVVGCSNSKAPDPVATPQVRATPLAGHTYMLPGTGRSMMVERQCSEIIDRSIRYTSGLNERIKVEIEVDQYTSYYDHRHYAARMKGDSTKSKQWVGFDAEDVPGTLLNKDLVPDVLRLATAVIEFDRAFQSDPNECEDRRGNWWKRIT